MSVSPHVRYGVALLGFKVGGDRLGVHSNRGTRKGEDRAVPSTVLSEPRKVEQWTHIGGLWFLCPNRKNGVFVFNFSLFFTYPFLICLPEKKRIYDDVVNVLISVLPCTTSWQIDKFSFARKKSQQHDSWVISRYNNTTKDVQTS